jgi:hypothetical protein
MTVDFNRHPLAALTGAMETVLELSGAGKVVEACNRLATALEALRVPAPAELPDGVRHDIHRLTAVLAFPTWEEVVRWAAVQGVDLRDLTEPELAYIERVSPRRPATGAPRGIGPAYRNKAGIRYPARELWT